MYDALNLVREPSTAEISEFEKRGFVFLPVEPKTLPEVIEENPDYFWNPPFEGETLLIPTPGYPIMPRALEHAKAVLSHYALPRATLIAVNPSELFIQGSFDKERQTQIAMTQEYSKRHIEVIQSDARSVMLPATALAQLDMKYKGTTGNALFINSCGRALEQTDLFDNQGAFVGRAQSDNRLQVDLWEKYADPPRIGAVSAVVFIRK